MVGVTNEPEQQTLEDAYDILLNDELKQILAAGDPGPQGPDPALDQP
jgi:hypothetical protein